MVHRLMLRSCDIDCLGLIDGKMGISILFFHYAKLTENPVFEDFAGDLLDDIWDNINKKQPIGFSTGLCGIAWGIEYLLQNGFVEGDGNSICEEIDKKIMAIDPRRLSDNSLDSGLEGILHYVLSRISGAIKQKNQIPFGDIYIHDLAYALKASFFEDRTIEKNKHFLQFISFLEENYSIEYLFDIKSFIEVPDIKVKEINSVAIGLRNGLAGYLLNQIIS